MPLQEHVLHKQPARPDCKATRTRLAHQQVGSADTVARWQPHGHTAGVVTSSRSAHLSWRTFVSEPARVVTPERLFAKVGTTS